MQGYSSGDVIPFVLNADASANAPTLVVKNLADGYVLNFGDHAFQSSPSAYTVAAMTLSGNQWVYLYNSTGLAATTVNAAVEYTVDGDVYTDDLPLNYSSGGGGGGDATKAIQLLQWRDEVASHFLGIKSAAYPINCGVGNGITLTAGQSIIISAVDVVASGDAVVLQDQQVISTITSSGVTPGPDWSPAKLSCSAIKVETVGDVQGNWPVGILQFQIAGDIDITWSVNLPTTSTGTFWIGLDGTLWSNPDEVGQIVPGSYANAAASWGYVQQNIPALEYLTEIYYNLMSRDFLGCANWLNADLTVTFTGNTGASTITLVSALPDIEGAGYRTGYTDTLGTISGSTYTSAGAIRGTYLLGVVMSGDMTTGGVITITHTDGREWAITVPKNALPNAQGGVFVDVATGGLVSLAGSRGNIPAASGITTGEAQAACAAALAAYPVPSAVSVAVAVNAELSSDHGAGSWVDTGGTGGTTIINVDEVKTVRHANLGQMPNTGEARKAFLGK